MSNIKIHRSDGIAIVTMNDGKANIMNSRFIGQLITAFRSSGEAGDVVVLQSSIDGTYSAGFDVKVLASRDPSSVLEMIRSGGELIHTMLTHPRPIVAVGSGRIFPMGLFTLLAADYRIGDKSNSQWCLNEARLGIVPPAYAFEILRYRLDENWLSRAALTASAMSADDGLSAGVFDQLADGSEANELSLEIAGLLSELPIKALAGMKQRLRGNVADRVRASIDRELTIANFRERYAQ